MKPKRKGNRLTDYDYSQNGAYFITICTHGRQKILWKSDVLTAVEDVGAHSVRPWPSALFSRLRANNVRPYFSETASHRRGIGGGQPPERPLLNS